MFRLNILCENKLYISYPNGTRYTNLINHIKDNALKGTLLNFLRPVPENKEQRYDKWGTEEEIYSPIILSQKPGALVLCFGTRHTPPITVLKNCKSREGAYRDLSFNLEFYHVGARYLGYEIVTNHENYGNAFYLNDGLTPTRDTHLFNSEFLVEALRLISRGNT